jgi:hypothetical protein
VKDAVSLVIEPIIEPVVEKKVNAPAPEATEQKIAVTAPVVQKVQKVQKVKKEAAAPAAREMKKEVSPELTKEAAVPVIAPAEIKKAEQAKKSPAKTAKVSKKRSSRFPPVSFGFIASGLLIGGLVGFILQRGRFCMNSAFRDVIFIKDYRFLRASIIALAVMIVGANILNDTGTLTLARQPLWFVAQIVGGYVFGLGMVMAGGCGSGIIYRIGEGQFNAVIATFGFVTGIAATSHGILRPVYVWLRSFSMPINGQPAPGLWHLLGGDAGITAKWGVIAVLLVIFGVFVLKGKPFTKKGKGLFWSVTGLLLGIIGVITFWASAHYGGFPRGLSFTTPLRDLFFTITTGNSMAGPPFKMHRIGYLITTWPALYILAVPFGAYISAKMYREFKWKVPPIGDLLTVFAGSLLMGFGATVAGGCNVGQALTGFATLSIGSILATIAIIAGNWTMVYYKFIKPMQELDLDDL